MCLDNLFKTGSKPIINHLFSLHCIISKSKNLLKESNITIKIYILTTAVYK